MRENLFLIYIWHTKLIKFAGTSLINLVTMDEVVVIVGAGPSRIATSACLKKLSIYHLILEQEECSIFLWK